MSELKVYVKPLKTNMFGETIVGQSYYLKSEADKVIESKDKTIAELNAERDALEKSFNEMTEAFMKSSRALWLMTAEWADAMGLASCNIAIKLSCKERFFYYNEAMRERDIKKYKHRQVVYYKYADYCRAKAEEYK